MTANARQMARAEVRPSSPLPYRPELDGLRAIAIILVVGSHAQIPGFGLGASAGGALFFVLPRMSPGGFSFSPAGVLPRG